MEFTCPTCKVVLEAEKLGDVRLWKCASCRGLVVSLPTVRKGLSPKAFKRIWQRLYAGETEAGRPCPGCKKPLSVVKADGKDAEILVDVCRSCQILWFDDNEFSSLPRVVPEAESQTSLKGEQQKRPESRLLTPEELTYRAFKEDQYQRRSFLYKLLDGSASKELGLDSFFGNFFDRK